MDEGIHDVAAGKLATVVTYLEMHAGPELRPVPHDAGVEIVHVDTPTLDAYRTLHRAVGGLPWLWWYRLSLNDDALAAIIQAPSVEVHEVRRAGAAIGFFELDFRQSGACELAYFGLVPDAVGGGDGRRMMNALLARVWRHPSHRISRLWVHTCTLDHPAALAFYIRSGFTPYKRAVEICDDPRVSGGLPRHAAPHVPVL